jgi:hypothetical protein
MKVVSRIFFHGTSWKAAYLILNEVTEFFSIDLILMSCYKKVTLYNIFYFPEDYAKNLIKW